jgi:hypothetical protein
MRVTGVCHAFLAYDLGFSVDLDAAESAIRETRGRKAFRHPRRWPSVEGTRPTPISFSLPYAPRDLGAWSTDEGVECLLYDFGAVGLTWSIPFDGPLEDVLVLSEELYDAESLLGDSRRILEGLLASLEDAVERPKLSETVEDYVIFEIRPSEEARSGPEVLHEQGPLLARILRAEPEALSEAEVAEALSSRISYGPEDVVVVDWNAALLYGEELEDERSLLEYATVELLELRILDELLENAVDHARQILSRGRGLLGALSLRSRDQRRIAEMQIDYAVLFEGVNNPLKLLGDQYLARLYELAARRFHLSDWDSGIERKLGMLESIYEKMVGFAGSRRLEVLEWIIIVLIALSIAVYFLP